MKYIQIMSIYFFKQKTEYCNNLKRSFKYQTKGDEKMTDKLIIKDSNFIKGWEKLLIEIEKNPKLEEVFIKSPASVLSEFLFDKSDKLSIDEIDKSNLLLFSIMSNKEFTNWAKEYEKTVIKKVEDPNELSADELSKIYEETIEALIDYADKDLLRAMFRVSPEEIKVIIRNDPKLRQASTIQERTIAVVVITLAVAVVAYVWVVVPSSQLGTTKVLSRSSLQNLNRQLVSQLERQSLQVRNKNFNIPRHKDMKGKIDKELKRIPRIDNRDLTDKDKRK